MLTVESAPDLPFVLRRTDRACGIPMLVVGYDESTQSVDARHPDGVEAPTLFLRSSSLALRQRRLGWEDVSNVWKEARTKPVVQPTDVLARATSRKRTRRSPKTTKA